MSAFGPNFLHETLYDQKLDDGARQGMISAYAIWNRRSPALEAEFMQELKLLDIERDRLSRRVEYFTMQEKKDRDIRELNNAYYDSIDLSRPYNILYDAMDKAGAGDFEPARQHAARAIMDLVMLQSGAQRMLEEAVGLHEAAPARKRGAPRP